MRKELHLYDLIDDRAAKVSPMIIHGQNKVFSNCISAYLKDLQLQYSVLTIASFRQKSEMLPKNPLSIGQHDCKIRIDMASDTRAVEEFFFIVEWDFIGIQGIRQQLLGFGSD